MIQDIILAGAGGCMREIAWQMQEQNKLEQKWNIIGFVDKDVPIKACRVGNIIIPYLGDDNFLLNKKETTYVAICVGEPKLRRKIAEKLMANFYLKFPDIILGDTRICADVCMGQGCIVSMDCRISTNVMLGNFVFLNTGSKVCHDGRMGDFVTLSPDVKLAGNVTIGSGTELGIGTSVIQGITIGQNTVVGAGAVVVRDIGDDCTAVGVPARVIK